jgi:hypothetical protein
VCCALTCKNEVSGDGGQFPLMALQHPDALVVRGGRVRDVATQKTKVEGAIEDGGGAVSLTACDMQILAIHAVTIPVHWWKVLIGLIPKQKWRQRQ